MDNAMHLWVEWQLNPLVTSASINGISEAKGKLSRPIKFAEINCFLLRLKHSRAKRAPFQTIGMV
jgi:hypothetical protein